MAPTASAPPRARAVGCGHRRGGAGRRHRRGRHRCGSSVVGQGAPPGGDGRGPLRPGARRSHGPGVPDDAVRRPHDMGHAQGARHRRDRAQHVDGHVRRVPRGASCAERRSVGLSTNSHSAKHAKPAPSAWRHVTWARPPPGRSWDSPQPIHGRAPRHGRHRRRRRGAPSVRTHVPTPTGLVSPDPEPRCQGLGSSVATGGRDRCRGSSVWSAGMSVMWSACAGACSEPPPGTSKTNAEPSRTGPRTCSR